MRIVMCPPQYFSVDYEINPHMNILNQPGKDLAMKQWSFIVETLSRLYVRVETIKAQKGLPDMVFVANAGLPLPDGSFLFSSFRYFERRSEEEYFEDFFSRRFNVVKTPKDVFFEGQGDAFFAGERLFLAYGFRSSEGVKPFLENLLPKRYDVIQLELVNPGFYHLDTALVYLGNNNFLAVWDAFSDKSRKLLEKQGNIIYLSDEDARNYCANAVVLKGRFKHIILNKATKKLKACLGDLGFEVLECPTSEFLKSGGSVRCLCLVF